MTTKLKIAVLYDQWEEEAPEPEPEPEKPVRKAKRKAKAIKEGRPLLALRGLPRSPVSGPACLSRVW